MARTYIGECMYILKNLTQDELLYLYYGNDAEEERTDYEINEKITNVKKRIDNGTSQEEVYSRIEAKNRRDIPIFATYSNRLRERENENREKNLQSYFEFFEDNLNYFNPSVDFKTDYQYTQIVIELDKWKTYYVNRRLNKLTTYYEVNITNWTIFT